MKKVLLVILVFIALTTTISGFIMIKDPGGEILNLPLSLLAETPFKDFLIPGILLAGIVGAVNMLAVASNILRDPARYNWAIAGGFMISGWIVVQMILIRAAHWLQFLYLGTGILIILLAYQLKGKWAV